MLPKIAGMAAKKLGATALKRVGGRLVSRAGSQLLRRVGGGAIRRVAPQLTRGVANVSRTLFRNRATRPLLHAVPRIARTTVARLAQHVARGGRLTPALAVRTLAQQTARTLGNPRLLARTYRRSLAQDRRYHQRTRRVLGRPAGAPVRATSTRPAASVGVAPSSWRGPTIPAWAGAANGGYAAAPPMGSPGMAAPVGAAVCPTCGR